MLKTYYRLAKPGIVYGNALVAIAGFLLASKHQVDGTLLLSMTIGLSLIVASSCVINNYLDRNIDAKMKRTQKRALVRGIISNKNALFYAAILGVTGCLVLITQTNALTLAIALLGALIYIVFYGIGKRQSVHGTLVGSAAGAVPPVVGYVAATNHLDTAALSLFLILAVWQMPHFYAIAMYRQADYAAAKLPVMSVIKGLEHTKLEILIYIGLFIICSLLPTFFGYTGIVYAILLLAAGCTWLIKGLAGRRNSDSSGWARIMFKYSLIVLLIFSAAISVGGRLP